MLWSPRVPCTLCLLLLTLTACSRGNADGPTVDEDVAAITALFDSFAQVASSGGADALLTLYADDAIWMLPDRWSDLNRAEASHFYRRVLDRARPDPETYSITVHEIVVQGDWAYVRHTDRGPFVPTGGGPAFAQGSRHLSILRREPNGAWRITRDIFNNPPLVDRD